MWFNLLLIVTTAWLYFPIFKYGFFQDDFLHLTTTQVPLSGLLKFFADNSAIYYRPLGIQLAYWLQQRLFGGYTPAWHLTSLIIHLANAFLVRNIILKLTSKPRLANLGSFLYATSATHFISLFWLAEFNLLLGALVLFSSLNLYLSGRLRLSLVSFGLGLLTHEINIVFPGLAILFRRPPKVYLGSVIVLTALYLLLRLVILPIPATGSYTPQFNSGSLNALIWYVLWSFNLPEELKYQVVLWPPYMQPKFLTNFMPHLSIWGVTFFGLLVAAVTKISLFGLSWFAIGISLFLILPLHQYPNYVVAGLPGITLLLSSAIAKFRPIWRGFLITLWLLGSFTTLRTTELTHWTVQEAQRVERLVAAAKRQHPRLPPQSTLAIKSDYQIQQALFGQLGLQYLYQDPTLTTYYGDWRNLMPAKCKIIDAAGENVRPCLARYNLYILD